MALFECLTEWKSRTWLRRLMDQVGAAGIVAASSTPALSSAIDQHAADVRDILLFGVEGSPMAAGAVLLAGYAKGLLDGAGVDAARLRESIGGRWCSADWLTLRLVAVCTMSRSDQWRRSAGDLPVK